MKINGTIFRVPKYLQQRRVQLKKCQEIVWTPFFLGRSSNKLKFNLSRLLWILLLPGISSLLLLVCTFRIPWSFPWYNSSNTLLFQILVYLSMSFIISTSRVSYLDSCVMSCLTYDVFKYSLFYRLHVSWVANRVQP